MAVPTLANLRFWEIGDWIKEVIIRDFDTLKPSWVPKLKTNGVIAGDPERIPYTPFVAVFARDYQPDYTGGEYANAFWTTFAEVYFYVQEVKKETIDKDVKGFAQGLFNVFMANSQENVPLPDSGGLIRVYQALPQRIEFGRALKVNSAEQTRWFYGGTMYMKVLYRTNFTT